MRQLYANNAKTSLSVAVGPSDTNLTVSDASKFPAVNAGEFFLATLELAGLYEIVLVTNRSGNNLTVIRGQEGTAALSFGVGTKVENRVTRDTLNRFSKAFVPIDSVNDILPPSLATVDGYLTKNSFDTSNSPVMVVGNGSGVWGFVNFTRYVSAVVTAATATSVTATSINAGSVATGKYLIQMTSGATAGYVRAVTACDGFTASWSGNLPATPAVGDTFDILIANSFLIQSINELNANSIVNAIVFGG